jgi:hypothetical protein
MGVAEIPVKIILQGQEEFESAIEDIGKSLVKGFALYEVGKQLYEFTKKGIEAFQAEALASAKLTNALGHQSVALEELSKSYSKSTLYSQKDVLAEEASLSLYVRSEKQIKKLTPAILDLAAATGMDLESAARLVGRTFETNAKQIGRTGVVVEGAAGSTQKLDSIYKGLIERFGGAAEAMSKSQGAMAQTGKHVEELSKTIASMIIGPVNKIASGLNYTVDGVNEFVSSCRDLIYPEMEYKKLAQDIKLTADQLDRLKKNQEQGKMTWQLALPKEDQLKRLKELQNAKAFQIINPSELRDLGVEAKGLNDTTDLIGKRIEALQKEISAEDALVVTEQEREQALKDYEKVRTELLKESEEGRLTLLKEEYDKYKAEFIKTGASTLELEKWYQGERKKIAQEEDDKVQEGLNQYREAEEKRVKILEKANEEKEKEIDKYNENLEKNQKKAYERQKKREDREVKDEMKAKDILAKYHEKDLDKLGKSKLHKMQEEHQKELAEALKYYGKDSAEYVLIATDQEKEIEELNKKEMEVKIQGYAVVADEALSNLSTIAEAAHAGAEAEKAIAIGKAIVNTAVGFTKDLTEYPGPLGIAMGILTLAAGAAQIASIEQQKMAYGGIAQGGIQGQDSIPAMLMPGEIVYNPAHPNPSLASLIQGSGVGSTSGDTTHMHIYGAQISVSGPVDKKTISNIGQAVKEHTIKGVHEALRTLQNRGKISGVTLFN